MPAAVITAEAFVIQLAVQMKNFVLALRANKSMSPTAFSDPKEIELRAKWLEEVKRQGIVVSLGGTMPPIPTMAATLFADGSVQYGPFTEFSHFLTGYLVIRADDLEAAKVVANTNPILAAGGSVEVREIILRD